MKFDNLIFVSSIFFKIGYGQSLIHLIKKKKKSAFGQTKLNMLDIFCCPKIVFWDFEELMGHDLRGFDVLNTKKNSLF